MRPMLRFQSKAYHPYIHASNGSVGLYKMCRVVYLFSCSVRRVLNMSRVFPMWDPGKHHLW